MTDQNLTHLYFLLDRSGSMESIKADIEGGFAAYVAEQRQDPGQCLVTLAQFDDDYEQVYADVPVADVPPLRLMPRGTTALLDALGRLITETGARLAELPEDERPGTVVVAVMTDGLENASREWTHARIKALIEAQSRDYQWEFTYLGADQDAIEVGRSVGIAPDTAVTYSRGKAGAAMAAQSRKIREYRERKRVDAHASMPAWTAAERESLR